MLEIGKLFISDKKMLYLAETQEMTVLSWIYFYMVSGNAAAPAKLPVLWNPMEIVALET